MSDPSKIPTWLLLDSDGNLVCRRRYESALCGGDHHICASGESRATRHVIGKAAAGLMILVGFVMALNG